MPIRSPVCGPGSSSASGAPASGVAPSRFSATSSGSACSGCPLSRVSTRICPSAPPPEPASEPAGRDLGRVRRLWLTSGVITPYDDYPIHQTADPVAHPASGDPNHYDRYFFNGFTRDGSVFFGGAMGHYPNRGIVDAAFSVVSDGVERSVFASGAMPADRATRIGPIEVEVVEPLRTIRLVLGPNDFGLGADLTFEARTPVVEEP